MSSSSRPTAAPTGMEMRSIARRVLNRGENDQDPIPFAFLNLLMVHLNKYPTEQHFLAEIKRDSGAYTLTCLDCWTVVDLQAAGDAQKKLQPFWDHISSGAHRTEASKRGQTVNSKGKERALIDFAQELFAAESATAPALKRSSASRPPSHSPTVIKTNSSPNTKIFGGATDGLWFGKNAAVSSSPPRHTLPVKTEEPAPLLHSRSPSVASSNDANSSRLRYPNHIRSQTPLPVKTEEPVLSMPFRSPSRASSNGDNSSRLRFPDHLRPQTPVKMDVDRQRLPTPSRAEAAHQTREFLLPRTHPKEESQDVEMLDLTLSSPPADAAIPRNGKVKRKVVFADGEELEYWSDEDAREPPEVAAMSTSTIPTVTVPGPSSSSARRRRVKRTVYLDGAPFEYSTDESEPETAQVPAASTSNAIQHATLVSAPPSTAASSSSSHYVSPFCSRFPSEPSTPMSASTSRPPALASSSFSSNLKRQRRGYRRVELDDQIIYLSTDDERVDERPDAFKRPRVASAQPLRVKSEYEDSLIPGLDNAHANNFMPGALPTPQAHQSSTSFGIPALMHRFGTVAQSAVNALQHAPAAVTRGLQDLQAVTGMQYQLPPPLQFAHPSVSPTRRPMGMHTKRPLPARVPAFPGTSRHPGAVASTSGAGLNMGGGFGAQKAGMPGMPRIMHHTPGYTARPNAGSFNLNYDDSDLPMTLENGLLDPHQSMQNFLQTAMDTFQDIPTVMAAATSLGLQTPNDILPGMEIKLMPHQLIGVDWMVKQELGEIRGGILADDMGLGKTIQCIATCVKNRPPATSQDKGILIVAPAALLMQWKREFQERTDGDLFRVHVHHGNDKLRTVAEVRKYNVVITTYQTLSGCFAKDKKKRRKREPFPPPLDSDEDDDDDASSGPRKIGPLAQISWWRVVLDEGQYIRNRATRASRIVACLDSIYRWVLTGTPVTNSLADLYGFVRFLRFSPFDNWKEYNNRIAKVQKKNPELAGQRSQAMLKKCLIRRNKYSEVEGKPILSLPAKDIEVMEVDFMPDELKVYQTIQEREQLKMSKFIKAGTVMKNYAFILVMLLRLRQACNHPSLLVRNKDELAEGEEIGLGGVIGDVNDPNIAVRAKVSDAIRAQSQEGVEFVEDLKARARAEAQDRIEAEMRGTDDDESIDNECPICFDPYLNNCMITQCKHKFCRECLNDHFTNPPTGLDGEDAAYGNMMDTGERPCPVCRQRIHPRRTYEAKVFEPMPAELNRIRASCRNAVKDNGVKEEDRETLVPHDIDLEDVIAIDQEFEPSSKMEAMMKLVRKWINTTDDKMILYSQWTSMLDLVQKLLQRDEIEFLRFDGKMSRDNRDLAVQRFKKRDGPRVMLISLKAGGVGLNLTEANRVISLDLAWNAATENQAFDRVHRMGQQKEVVVKRLIIKGTIEERIMNLQTQKQQLADAALGEGDVQKIKKMSVQELAYLFGM